MREINYFEKDSLKKFPQLKKTGVISPNDGETTPFIYKGRLLRLENQWSDHKGLPSPCAVIDDYFTNEELCCLGGDRARFYSAYCENDRVYVFATLDNKVYRYVSDDLVTWTSSVVLTMPESFELFNTSVCKGDGKYMMAIECSWAGTSKGDGTNAVGNPYIGVLFTEFFAQSQDLEHWENLPLELNYTPERYCACPALRYCDGYYYMICLEQLPAVRFAPYMYRTKDFETWEIGLYNPILMPSEEDRRVKAGVEIPQELAEKNAHHVDINNSDVDLCEYMGKTYINYITGNQTTWGGLICEAVYDGPLDEYLKANFE